MHASTLASEKVLLLTDSSVSALCQFRYWLWNKLSKLINYAHNDYVVQESSLEKSCVAEWAGPVSLG